MIYSSKIYVVLVFGLLTISPILSARPEGISGMEVQNGCMCHGSKSNQVVIETTGWPDQFRSNEDYNITISIRGGPDTGEGVSGGFNIRVNTGHLYSVENHIHITDDGLEATHTLQGNERREWNLTWKGPEDDTIEIEVRISVNSVNGDGEVSGDKWNITTFNVRGINATSEGMGDGYAGLAAGIVVILTAIMIFLRITFAARIRRKS